MRKKEKRIGACAAAGIFLCAAVGCSAWTDGEPAGPASSSVHLADQEFSQEERTMRREICTVEAVYEDYFVLRNTLNERYHMEITHLGSFQPGDKAYLRYTERTADPDGFFTVPVSAVVPADQTICPLMN